MNSNNRLATLMATYPQRPDHLNEPLCLDFIDTVDVHDGTSYYDDLSSYRDVVLWGYSVGVLDERQAEWLLEEGERRPEEAAAIHQRAMALRGSLYGLFSAAVHETGIPDGDLTVFNAELEQALSKTRLVPDTGRLAWGWASQGNELDYPLWPVARAAAQLLSSDDLARVGECASDTCQWLFLDTSKNHGRRFCGEGCSNRTRVRRHRERQRAESLIEEAGASRRQPHRRQT